MAPITGSGTGAPVVGVLTQFEALPYPDAVWVWDNSAGAYINNTVEAQTGGGTAFSVLADTVDYVYIGSRSRFDLALFIVAVGGTIGSPVWEHYNGASWVRIVFDRTIARYNFLISGGEQFDNLVDTAALAFSAGTPHAGAPPDTTARYWIRISTASVTTAPTISAIEIRPYAYYCTATDVANLLQIDADFSSTTTPTRTTVENYIHKAQALIDYRARKSWRLNIEPEEIEEYDFNYAGFKLKRPDTREILRLQIWNGDTYETRTQGRDQEYFVVRDLGMVHFSRYFLLPARLQHNVPVGLWGWAEYTFPVRVAYTWGKDRYRDERQGPIVWDIAQKLAAIDLVQNYDYGVLTVSGVDKVSLEAKVRLWREEIDDLLDNLRSWETF